MLTALLSSCEDSFLEKNLDSSGRVTNFEYLWNQIDKKYSFFDLKNVDWLKIKEKYKPLISEEMSDEDFFHVLASMMNELKDGHSNLIAPFNSSSYDFTKGYPVQIHPPLLQDLFPNLARTGNLSHSLVANTNVGYIRFPDFSNLTEDQLDYVLNKYKGTKGLILDIRNNPGGAGILVNLLLSRFTKTDITVGFEQMRNGPDYNDFSSPAPAMIEAKGSFFSSPIVVLIDRGSYSSSTYFALATKSMDNITLIGDTTGGGAGMPNGGELPNGWTYRFSITRFLSVDKKNYAENGVEPDIKVDFDWSNLTKDEVIDAAVSHLSN